MRPLSRSIALFVVMLALAGGSTSLRAAQTTQKPPTQTAKPPQKPPAQPAKTVETAKTPAAPAPAAPVPQDLKYGATYTAEGLKTESVAYVKGQRERFEFQDIVLLKQHDQKRTIQIMKTANTYLVVADGAIHANTCGFRQLCVR